MLLVHIKTILHKHIMAKYSSFVCVDTTGHTQPIIDQSEEGCPKIVYQYTHMFPQWY